MVGRPSLEGQVGCGRDPEVESPIVVLGPPGPVISLAFRRAFAHSSRLSFKSYGVTFYPESATPCYGATYIRKYK